MPWWYMVWWPDWVDQAVLAYVMRLTHQIWQLPNGATAWNEWEEEGAGRVGVEGTGAGAGS